MTKLLEPSRTGTKLLKNENNNNEEKKMGRDAYATIGYGFFYDRSKIDESLLEEDCYTLVDDVEQKHPNIDLPYFEMTNEFTEQRAVFFAKSGVLWSEGDPSVVSTHSGVTYWKKDIDLKALLTYEDEAKEAMSELFRLLDMKPVPCSWIMVPEYH